MTFDLILDIDGVMIPYPDGDMGRPCYFGGAQIACLQRIFKEHPNTRIIFSTSMRNNERDRATLSRMWSSAQLPHEKIRGYITPSGALNENREAVLKYFLKENPGHYLVVEDELIFGLDYFKVDSRKGLTEEATNQIITILHGGITKVSNDQPWSFGYSHLKDPTDSL